MKKNDVKDSARNVKILTGIIIKLSRSDMEKRLKNKGLKISPLAFGVMRILSKERCTMVQLSERMMLCPATLVPVIDSLEKKGFIRRESDPKDRRINPLSVTEKGKKLISAILALSKEDIIVKSLKKMGNKKTTETIALLKELVKYMGTDKPTKENILKIFKE